MDDKLKYSVLLIALTGALTGCNVKGTVNESQDSTPNNQTYVSPVKRITYANNPLSYNWYNGNSGDQGVHRSVSLNSILARNVYLILDMSDTTKQIVCFDQGFKEQALKNAAVSFIDSLAANTNLGIINFDANGPREIADLESHRPSYLKQLLSDTDSGGTNPIAISFSYAFKSLQRQALKQQGYGTYDIVLLTDGGSDNESELIHTTRTITESSPVVIHVYELCATGENLLSKIPNVDYKPLHSKEDVWDAINSTYIDVSMSYDEPHFEQ